MRTKKCKDCLEVKPIKEFYLKRSTSDGRSTWCKVCHGVRTKTRFKERRADPKFVEAESARIKAWRVANPLKYTEASKRYRVNNPDVVANAVAAYRSGKANRTPTWLSEDDEWMLQEVYALAVLRTKLLGFSWEVDHIIPLHGRTVSGLHTPFNLQVIPMLDNRVKSNRF